MLAAHRYCSEYRLGCSPRNREHIVRAMGLTALVALAGCNVSKGLDLESTSALPTQDHVLTGFAAVNTKPTLRPTLAADAVVNAGEPVSLKSTQAYGSSKRISQRTDYNQPVLSAKCRQILASAGIETTILRSPTVAAEANDDGKVGASISYDFVDLRRANLKEDLAFVQCRRNHAAVKMAQLLLTTPQALSRAGYLAKANSLQASGKQFVRIKSEINSFVRRGVMTVQAGTALKQHLNYVRSGEANARSDAARREVVDEIQLQNVAGLDRELLETEREAHRLERKLRTADAVKLNLSGGYSTNSGNGDQIVSTGEGAYAKVSVSMRLGAFRQLRDDYENELGSARQDSYSERYTGSFWKAKEIEKANRRALKALHSQRKQILAAINEANKNSKIRLNDYEQELVANAVRARIDRIALRAELSGVDATISDTRRISKKLRF